MLVHGDNSTSAWIYRVSDNKMITPIKASNKSTDLASVRTVGEINEIRWHYICDHPYRFYYIERGLPSSFAVQGETVGMSFYSVDLDPKTLTLSAPTLVHVLATNFRHVSTMQRLLQILGLKIKIYWLPSKMPISWVLK